MPPSPVRVKVRRMAGINCMLNAETVARSCKSWRDEYSDGISERILLPTSPHLWPEVTSFSRAGGGWNDSFPAWGLSTVVQCSAKPAVHMVNQAQPNSHLPGLWTTLTQTICSSTCAKTGASTPSLCSPSDRAQAKSLDLLTEEVWGQAQELPIQPDTFSNNPLSGESTQLQCQLIWVCRWFDLYFKKKMTAVLFLHSSWMLQLYSQQMCRREDNFPWQQGQKNYRNSLLLSSSSPLTLSTVPSRGKPARWVVHWEGVYMAVAAAAAASACPSLRLAMLMHILQHQTQGQREWWTP